MKRDEEGARDTNASLFSGIVSSRILYVRKCSRYKERFRCRIYRCGFFRAPVCRFFSIYGIRSLRFRLWFPPTLILGTMLFFMLFQGPDHLSSWGKLSMHLGNTFGKRWYVATYPAYGVLFSLHHYLLPRRK